LRKLQDLTQPRDFLLFTLSRSCVQLFGQRDCVFGNSQALIAIASARRLKFEPTALAQIVEGANDSLAWRLERLGCPIHVDLKPGLAFLGMPKQLF